MATAPVKTSDASADSKKSKQAGLPNVKPYASQTSPSLIKKKSPTIRDWQLYTRLWGYVMPYKGRFLVGMLAALPTSLTNGALAFLIGPFVDQLVQQQNYAALFYIPAAVMAVSIVQGVCEYVSTYYTTYVATALSQDVRLQLYEQLVKMDLKYLNGSKPGDLLSRYYEDPSRLQTAIVTNIQKFVIEFFSIVGLSAVLLYRSWSLALIAIAVISTIVIPIAIISKKLRRLDHENQRLLASIYDVFNESITGAKVVMIFGLQAFQYKRFKRRMQDYFGNSMSLARADAILRPLLQLIASVGIALILLFGSFRVTGGDMSPGELTSFLVALLLLYKPVKNVGGIITKVQRVFAPAERVFEKIDLEPELQDHPNPAHFAEFESLEFDQVHFAYNAEVPVLSDINLTVHSGEKIALVGESGGGKSTLVDLIPRFMDPTAGEVRMNGMDIRQVSMSSIRDMISLVSQDTVLFDGSVLENIRLGNMDATRAQIDEAIRVAHLDEMIAAMPEGIHTQIGPRGSQLSGGQKQRLAIARAFLSDSPIVILDEATSALDNESEAAVQDGMAHVIEGKTVFVVAHRLSTVRYADRILVMHQGKIAEQGTHDELMKQEGMYHRLYSLQFRHDV